MKLTIKKFQTMRTLDGGGYSYDLHIDGVKAAFVIDEGHGGMVMAQWYDRSLEPAFNAHVASLPPKPVDPNAEQWVKDMHPKGFETVTDEMVFEDLAADYELEKKLRSKCKKMTCFRLPSDARGEFRTLNSPYSPKAKEWILKKYPDAVILNEAQA
jgi:hypothetical protein